MKGKNKLRDARRDNNTTPGKLFAIPKKSRVGFVFAFLLVASISPLIHLSTSLKASAQTTVFFEQFGSTGSDLAIDVAVDSTGVYVVGSTDGDLEGTSAGLSDAYLQKYDTNGNLQWTDQFGTSEADRASAVAVDSTGVYVVGGTQGDLEGTSEGSFDAFVRKYSLDGSTVEWTDQFGTWSGDSASGVALDSTGVYVVGSTCCDSFLQGDGYLRKYSLEGNLEWINQFGGVNDDAPSSVAVDASGVYVVGTIFGEGDQIAFVRKYSLDGSILDWIDEFRAKADRATDVAVDSTGVYVVGRTCCTESRFNEAFVRKYSPDGNLEWINQFHGSDSKNSALGVAASSTGVYVVGQTGGELEGGDPGATGAFARKYDTDGNLKWTKQDFGQSSSDHALGVAVGASGVYVVGTTDASLNGIPGGEADSFLAKLTESSDTSDDETFCGREVSDFDNVIEGTAGSDSLNGTEADDLIRGFGGDDIIDGKGGSDCLIGNGGNDILYGGPGDDAIYGGEGDDEIYGNDGNDVLYGNAGDDLISGGEGDDYLAGKSGNDNLFGNNGNDKMFGNEGNDYLKGGDGDDIMFGGEGHDVLLGNTGADRMSGHSGDDEILGGRGDDRLRGGEGMDALDGGRDRDICYDDSANLPVPIHCEEHVISGPENCDDGIDNDDDGSVDEQDPDCDDGPTPPSQERIAFSSSRDEIQEIFVMNADGSNQKRLTINASAGSPDWSPDGTKIAFTSFRDDDPSDEIFNFHDVIYVMNADGSGQTRLTNGSANDLEPSWSPDGTKIAFISDRDGNTEIYVMNADGSGQTNVSDNPSIDSSPDWSPDGTKIAFTSQGADGNGIHAVNADGSGITIISNNSDSSPSWSPDGSQISFTSARDGNEEVYVMNADGSEQTRLTNNPSFDRSPEWSPDGTKIAFSRDMDVDPEDEVSNNEIFVMDADGSGQVNISNDPYSDLEYSWSPDGTRIVFNTNSEGDTQIFVVNADGSDLTRLSNIDNLGDSSPDFGLVPADPIPPVVTTPENQVAEATTPEGVVVNYPAATAVDDVDGLLVPTCEPPSGSTFPVGITNVSCTTTDAAGNLGQSSFTVTVLEEIPDISIDDVSMTEGDSETKEFNFTIARSGNITGASSVDFETADVSATIVDSDYAFSSGTIEFAAGETTKTITIVANGDTTDEPIEIFIVNLSNCVGCNITIDHGAGIILSDDLPDPANQGRIAFVSNRDGNFEFEIYVMNADGSEQTNISNSPALDWEPSWSPDGTKIAFTSYRNGHAEVHVMNADGSNQTGLSNGESPSWSPDGARIAFTGPSDDPDAVNFNSEISIMNADGSDPIMLTNSPGVVNSSPDWSPDGTKIAFTTCCVDGNFEIFVMNADGSEQTKISDGGSPDWSPDGTKIAFARNLDGGFSEIFVMNPDGSNQTNISNNPAADWEPRWSPDGTKIVFHTAERPGDTGIEEEIYVMNADGSNQTNISNNPFRDSFPDFGWASASALDKIAFTSTRDGNFEIYIMDADGSDHTRLTNSTDLLDSNPSLSADGSKILFESVALDSDDPTQLFVIDADGTDLKQLTNTDFGKTNIDPSWSPDGTKIAFSSDRDPGFSFEIFVMNADGTNIVRITDSVGDNSEPSWSPDGTKIAFLNGDDGAEIHLMNSDGTGQTRLTNNSAFDAFPSWSPDGTKIAFASNRDSDVSSEIYVMNSDGTGQTRLTHDLSAYDTNPSWSQDGTKIAFSSNRDGPIDDHELYIMNADGTSQTKLTDTVGDNLDPDF